MDPTVLHDIVAGFQAAPLWAQIGMSLFALTALTMAVDEPLRHRRYRRRFDAILQGLGRPPSTTPKPPMTVTLDAESQRFELTYKRVYRGKGSTYRGPTGQLFVSATTLIGNRWQMHQVDVEQMGGLASRLIGGVARTGDAAFDKRFMVREDGLPAREGWLDPPTRQAFTDFFDRAPTGGVLWIRDGQLQYIIADSWKSLDGTGAGTLLRAQVALSSALNRTAAARH